MQQFQEQRKLRAFFASRTVLIVLFLLLIGTGVMSFQALLAGKEVEREREEVEQELMDLEQRKGALSSELDELYSGRGVEYQAREKLNYRKPGEEVVIIVEGERTDGVGEEEQEAGILQKIWRWLGL